MCGIVGAIAERDVLNILIEGLRRLEYRGYDSAGVAVIEDGQTIERARTAGKVADLERCLDGKHLSGHLGVAHTRWATHGEPNESNAHPHICRGRVAVVHNGIIENYEPLREALRAKGYEFESETDTEVIANQIDVYLAQGKELLDAVRATVNDLEGAYALAVISTVAPGRIVAARRGPPLVIGVGVGEHYVASDVAALISVTQQFVFLEDGDVAYLSKEAFTICDRDGRPVNRRLVLSELTADAVDKGQYRHYMLKEIYEQPQAIANTLEGRFAKGRILEAAFGPNASEIFDKTRAVQIIACGTSYHAGLVARHWFEELAGVSCNVEVASEFRYRQSVVKPDTLLITISQSGETADTLAALRGTKSLGYVGTLGIVNAPESSLVRESDLVLMTRAGPEIGVASTKAFTTQLTALLLLVIVVGRRHALREEAESALVQQLRSLPAQCDAVLAMSESISRLSERFADKNHTLFLGRGMHFPVAMEGALKLKEISYIHAEAYPAGELKHGPLALVDADMPVVAVAPNDALIDKLRSNLEEVRARGGELYVFADRSTAVEPTANVHVMSVPETGETVSPIIYTIPLQLLAYHVAVLKGTDVDQPRNLAKSVTVE